MPNETAIAGRRVLITGGGAGIGAVTARLLSEKGCSIALLDRDGEAARRVTQGLGKNAFSHEGEVIDAKAIAAVLDKMVETWGGIDDLVNNAGTFHHGPLLELTREHWQQVLDVNLMAPIMISNAAVHLMNEGGAIVNVSSVLGQVSAPTRGPYCVSKSALISLTKMQAIEWAERGIRVNAIAPGYILNEPVRALAVTGSFDIASIERRTPMRRLGTEQEVAEGIAFLLEPGKAGYITGHTLEVNGGWTAYGFI